MLNSDELTVTEEAGVPASGTTEPATQTRPRLRELLGALLMASAVAVFIAMLTIAMAPEAVGGLTVVLLLLFIAMDVPVGIGMMLAGSAGIYALSGDVGVVNSSVVSIAWGGVASWSLSVIPMFLLMGLAMWHGGMAAKAFAAANVWGGRVPGGLAVATTGAGAGLAAASGSTMAISLALGRMAIPEMLREGYKPSLAIGSVAMAGSLGQVIPPSILLVVYAGVAETPVGPQLAAGIIPGIALAIGFCALIVVRCTINPSLAPRRQQTVTWGQRAHSLVDASPLFMVIAVVIGGLYGGLLTPTEVGAIGALLTLLYCFMRPTQLRAGAKENAKLLKTISVESVSTTASVFLMVVGSLVLSRAFTLSGLAQGFSEWLLGMDLGRVGLLLALIVVYIVLGMFLESMPMMLLTIPLLQAPLEASGVNMVWFGIFLILLCEIGMVFPPVGLLLFVVHRLAKEPSVNLGIPISLNTAFRGIYPFVAVVVAFLLLIIAFPDIVMWLPNHLNQ